MISLKTIAFTSLLGAASLSFSVPTFAQKAQQLPTALPQLAKASYQIVPLPQKVTLQQQWGAFPLSARTCIVRGKSKADKANAQFLQQFVAERTGLTLPITTKRGKSPAIVLNSTQKGLGNEAYQLHIDSTTVSIAASSSAGAFYGIQTLRKSLPHLTQNERATLAKQGSIALPGAEIADAPRFAYRGAMLDVARHYVTPDSVKRFIDMIALHGINRFHWHLTDDQGWRIEIKQLPELTTIGSVRKATVIGKNTGKYDGIPHGGFYTQAQCKEIVAYAAARNIEIIPEIDLPGHMVGALAAYPHLGCTGGPYEVSQMWGVMDDVLCAGNPETFKFIDTVLGEVAKIFPATYFHIGGDECPKTRWKSCPKCQAFIKQNHLEAENNHTAEERLQSYVIRHAEQTLARYGKRIIGWDEILEGGLAPNATVMSWRGEKGGIEAAKGGHDVIMSPNTYLYFDYYQAKDADQEPYGIGGFLPLERVYSYEPYPAALQPEEAKRIVGVQANLWSEYFKTYRHVEYMALPRLAALAEIQWCGQGTRKYADFVQRLPQLLEVYREQNYNFAQHYYDIQADYAPIDGGIRATLRVNDANDAIFYTLDGTMPTMQSTRYTAPLDLKGEVRFRAAAFHEISEDAAKNLASTGRAAVEIVRQGGKIFQRSHIEKEDFHFSKSTSRTITLAHEPHPSFKFGGTKLLVDGLVAQNTNHNSGRWMGFYTQPLEATIDLGESTEVKQVAFNTCVEKGSWIYDVRRVEISVSQDGKTWKSVVTQDFAPLTEANPNAVTPHVFDFAPAAARFVKVVAQPESSIPAWHEGAAGHPAFLFVDEISIN